MALNDRLARARVTAGGRELPGARRHDRDRREPARASSPSAARIRTRSPCASHQRAVAAQQAASSRRRSSPVAVPQRKGDAADGRHRRAPPRRHHRRVAREAAPDPRQGRPRLHRHRRQRSGQNDGAAICIVTTPEKAEELGLRPFARLVSWAVAGVPPRTMGIGPVPATEKALEPRRPVAVRHGRHRAQRGLRRAGARRAAQVGPRGRDAR